MPATPLKFTEPTSVDAIARQLQPLIDGTAQWSVAFPTERDPAMRVAYRVPGKPAATRRADPATSAFLPEPGTWAGTRFIFAFHYSLHLSLWSPGYEIVGLAGMAMLVPCVSGVVIHRTIFTDFFTVRPHRKAHRLLLDLHTAAGVLGLLFHSIMALYGLVIFFTIYFPDVRDIAYRDDRRAFDREAFGTYSRARTGQPATATASLDRMIATASTLWDGAKVNIVPPVVSGRCGLLRRASPVV